LYFNAERLAIVGEICEEVERIPLAIELAASRVSALGFDELRKRLKGGIKFAGNRDLPARHQTMGATIAWSCDLLTDMDRLLFERLSVFIGGFTLEAAEAVCVDASFPVGSIVDGVLRLVQKSLIEGELIETSTRYHFLESIRSFAWERLSKSGEVNGVMLRLIGWLVQETRLLAQQTSPELIIKLRSELENLAASVNWAIVKGDAATIVAAARALSGFRQVYYGTSSHGEMRMLGFALLEKLQDGENPEVLGLLARAMAACPMGEEQAVLKVRAIPLPITTGHASPVADFHAGHARQECTRENAQAG
jgi:predicted ATPase